MELFTILAFIPLALAPALISAAATVGGGVMSAMSAGNANAGNMAMNAQNVANQERINQQNLQFQREANLENQQFQREANLQNQIFTRETNAQNWDWTQQQNAWNALQVQKQMDWQQLMSGTQYQRAMKDMEAAGLNPILAYQQGGAGNLSGGAASGSAPTAQAPHAQALTTTPLSGGKAGENKFAIQPNSELGRAIGNAVSSAVDVHKTVQGVKVLEEDEKLRRDQQENVKVDTIKKGHEAAKVNEEVNKVISETNVNKIMAHLLKEQTNTAAGEAANMDKYGKREAPDTLERILRILQDKVAPTTLGQ